MTDKHQVENIPPRQTPHLEPCPFCGSDAWISEIKGNEHFHLIDGSYAGVQETVRYQVKCSGAYSCPVSLPATNLHADKNSAIKAWNKRSNQ